MMMMEGTSQGLFQCDYTLNLPPLKTACSPSPDQCHHCEAATGGEQYVNEDRSCDKA